MSEEIWKDVKGYEGFYMVSSEGKVKSIPRNTTGGRILKPAVDRYGYLTVCLCKNGTKKHKTIHRLVADAFIENPENYPSINHKDENKQNNACYNLEWCTPSYNTAYNNGYQRRGLKRRKRIVATKEGAELHFGSITEAAEYLGVLHGNISGCLHGAYGRKTLKGYSFRWE